MTLVVVQVDDNEKSINRRKHLLMRERLSQHVCAHTRHTQTDTHKQTRKDNVYMRTSAHTKRPPSYSLSSLSDCHGVERGGVGVKIEHEVLFRCLHAPNGVPLDAGSREAHEAFLLRCADQGRQFKEGDVHWQEILKRQYTTW